VIAAGPRAGRRARRIRARSRGRTWAVQVGPGAGARAAGLDLVVSTEAEGFFPDPRRLEIAAPLVWTAPEALAEARRSWRKLFAVAPAPRLVVLVGPEAGAALGVRAAARLAAAAVSLPEAAGGSVFALLSDRLSSLAVDAIVSGLGEAGGDGARVHVAGLGERCEPLLAHLALGDAFLVSGDSERLLAAACTSGKPVVVYPLAPPRRGPRERLRAAMASLARAEPGNDRGTVRPQQGLERLCSRLIERGVVRPPRDLGALHGALVRRGAARLHGSGQALPSPRPLREADAVALRVRELLGAD
jgi:mitochondrial fission protein ELM1